ncbi:short chain dehydrogenase [Seinonella peptonophila]|uniref:Short chain dehydrogenase n=1 Tax=Seinonella peptonophila TaxID=112248 RepID=A0A1M5A4I4_9BACL|nr:SDR family NAD(P)-dependent oxidoreductase [Seinonella peptonophila]SHF25134.1 short chain dehydrogenase [Seinonella peptonophila]
MGGRKQSRNDYRCSSGIGKATAKMFGKLGRKVFITYINHSDAALQTVEEIRSQGGYCEAIRMELNDTENIQQAVMSWLAIISIKLMFL